MKDNYPRLIPMWFIPLLLLMVFGLIQCGCRTGGTRLNPNSAGTIIRTSDVRPDFQPLPPVPIAPPRPTPIVTSNNAVRSTPTLPEPQSAKANPVVVNPESAGKLEPFTPTISTEPAKLPPTKPKLPPKLIEGDGGCVRPLPTDDNATTSEIAGPYEAAPKEGSVHRSKVGLFSVFVMLLLGAIGFWVVYDMVKDSIQMKKQGAPIKDHLKDLKKPAKGTRAGRKKAVTKKKSTKKKK